MDSIFESYIDKDKNFIREFQTSGFSARVWELSLFAFLQESDVELDVNHPAPDYIVRGRFPLAIEATTSQPPQGEGADFPSDRGWAVIPSDLSEDEREFVFQIAKSLRRKMLHQHTNKFYWELDHVRDNPFVIAVQAFHKPGSLFFSTSFASQYLYGFKPTGAREEDGSLRVYNQELEVHTWKDRDIPSGFFELPDAQHVSAVLFSNAGTVPQFDRIGRQMNLGTSSPVILRTGICPDPDPDADVPRKFAYIVGDVDSPEENFSQAIHIMHNPHAEVPLPFGTFPNVTEHAIDPHSGLLESTYRDFSPFASVTSILEGAGGRQFAEKLRREFLQD